MLEYIFSIILIFMIFVVAFLVTGWILVNLYEHGVRFFVAQFVITVLMFFYVMNHPSSYVYSDAEIAICFGIIFAAVFIVDRHSIPHKKSESSDVQTSEAVEYTEIEDRDSSWSDVIFEFLFMYTLLSLWENDDDYF